MLTRLTAVTVRPWIHDDSGKLKLLVKKQWRPNGTKVFQHLRDWQKQKDIADDTSNSIETRQGAETRMSELMEKALTAGTILSMHCCIVHALYKCSWSRYCRRAGRPR